MLYFQVASVILAYGSRRADWCSSTFGSPQNNFGGYHTIIVAQRGKNCNPFNETSLSVRRLSALSVLCVCLVKVALEFDLCCFAGLV